MVSANTDGYCSFCGIKLEKIKKEIADRASIISEPFFSGAFSDAPSGIYESYSGLSCILSSDGSTKAAQLCGLECLSKWINEKAIPSLVMERLTEQEGQ